MEGSNFSLTSLLIVTVLSFLVPIGLSKIKRIYIPVVVGEIIVGMIIGKSGFDLITMDESLEFIQFFGLAYLMFVAGLEIDFDIFIKNKITKKNRSFKGIITNPLILAITIVTISLTLAYLAALALQKLNLITDPLLMALIIGTTSLGVVIPVLKEKNISGTKYGQYILTIAVIADFVTMLLISVVVSLYKGGLSADILLVFGLIFLVFLIYRLSTKFQKIKLFKDLAHGTTQIGVRGSFAVMLLFLVLSQSIGVEMILGAFLAGTVISLVSQSHRTEIYHKLDAIGFGFLIPIFFILVGVNFDASVLLNNPKGLILVPILFVLLYFIKGVPALLLKLLFPWKQSIAGGVLLTSQLSLTIAAAAIGLEIGAISEEVSAALLLVAILTSLFSPLVFGKMIPTHKNEEEDKHVVIIGTTKQGILLAKRLMEKGTHVLIIESKREKVDEVITTGIEVVYGDATDINLLEELDIGFAKAIIVGTGSDEINYQISDIISRSFSKEVITLLTDPYYIDKVNKNELIRFVNPQLSTINLLENMIYYPVAVSLFEEKMDVHMEEVEVINKDLIGKKLRFIKLPGDVLIFAVYRDGETLLPHGDTSFEFGDILLVMGSENAVKDFSAIATSI